MKKHLILAVLLLAAALGIVGKAYRRAIDDRNRLSRNQTTLLDSVDHYRTAAGREAASVQALELKVSELERYKADAVAEIRSLGIKLRRVESVATTTARTEVRIATSLNDSVRNIRLANLRRAADTVKARINREYAEEIAELSTAAERLKTFAWADPHTQVSGIVTGDSVICNVTSVDTLRQVVHRVPRRFLFIRWGTKAIRQEIVSSNPHTRIVYAEYIDMRRRPK